MSKFPAHLTALISYLKKLPGVGSKTAERYAFHLLNWSERDLELLASHIGSVKEKIQSCSQCHCLMEDTLCTYCEPSKRDMRMLCILSSTKDVFAFEETRSYRGLYHIIGGLLSPLAGLYPQNLDLAQMIERIRSLHVEEVIIALDSTLEGDATSLYIKQKLEAMEGVRVSRLAFGLPLNSSLDFIDGGTLVKAFTGRQVF